MNAIANIYKMNKPSRCNAVIRARPPVSSSLSPPILSIALSNFFNL